jgi:hypothetical protein
MRLLHERKTLRKKIHASIFNHKQIASSLIDNFAQALEKAILQIASKIPFANRASLKLTSTHDSADTFQSENYFQPSALLSFSSD